MISGKILKSEGRDLMYLEFLKVIKVFLSEIAFALDNQYLKLKRLLKALEIRLLPELSAIFMTIGIHLPVVGALWKGTRQKRSSPENKRLPISHCLKIQLRAVSSGYRYSIEKCYRISEPY